MDLLWTLKSQDDLERIYRFACQYSRQHADTALDELISGIERLIEHPQMGSLQPRYEPREVRKMLFGDYEVHYEVQDLALYIVDIWHTREDR